MKRCPQCNENLRDDAFYHNKATTTGLSSWCKECTKQKIGLYQKARSERIIIAGGKTCSRCKVWKPANKFYPHNRDGITSRCKDCTKDDARQILRDDPDDCHEKSHIYYEHNREHIREVARQRRARHSQECNERNRQHYATDADFADRCKKQSQEYRQKYPDKVKASVKNWNESHVDYVHQTNLRKYIAHREERIAYNRAYYPAHKDAIVANNRKWRHEHPDERKAQNHRRRCKKNESSEHFTVAQWRAMLTAFGYRCLRCGRTDSKLTPDHVIPIAFGGSNGIANIQPLCFSCNSSKQDTIADYRNPRMMQELLGS